MVEFIENGHIYLKDGIIVPSVSSILHFIFPDKYKNVPISVLNKKAEYGTKVHESIEKIEQTGEIIEFNVYQKIALEQYLKLKKMYDIEVLEQEKIISYEYDYCGRFDMIARIGTDKCLCDIKTTSILDEEYLSWQLSFYELATGEEFDKLYAIWLPKKELGKLVEIKRKSKKELLDILKKFKERKK